MSNSKIIVALDYPDMDQALAMARKLDPDSCRLKVGKELFTVSGPLVVDALHQLGFELFLDLKFHDIPNTVARAVAAAARMGVWMVNVHASGGREMMLAARDSLLGFEKPPLLIAVTVLTSMQPEDLRETGVERDIDGQVKALALMASECGLDGVVCSARETAMLRQCVPSGFLLVTPGIRPEKSALDDQKRVVTPGDAVQQGSDYLVMGRPITKSDTPLEILLRTNKEIAYRLSQS